MSAQQIVRPDGATVVFHQVGPPKDDAGLAPLVFLPGWLCTADSWHATAARWGRFRRCVTIDLPGFGASSAGARTDWSLAAFGADVAAVLAALGDERIILVGHSMGGAVALEAAIIAPDRCLKVVAVDSLIHPAFYDPTDEAAIEPVVAAFADDFAAAIPAAMAGYLIPGRSVPAVTDAIARMAAADPDRGLAVLRNFLRWDVYARLSAVDIPIAVIAAAGFVSAETRARWIGRIDLRTIKDVGHFIMLDNPAVFDTVLAAILADD